MKNILYAVLIVVMLLSGVGCDQGKGNEPAAKPTANKPQPQTPPSKISQPAASPATLPPKGKIRLALIQWVGYGPFFIARDQSFFKRQGLEVDICMIEDTMQRRAAFQKGQIDAMISTTDAFAVEAAAPNNLPGKVVLMLDESYGGDAIVARGIYDILDLRGKKVSYTKEMPSHFFLLYLLLINGIAYNEVELHPTNTVEEAAKLFEDGAVDAAVVWEPFVSRLKNKFGGHVLIDSRQARGLISDILVVRDSLLQQRADDVRKLVIGWCQAVEYQRKYPKQAAKIMARGFKMSEQEVQEGVAGIKYGSLTANQKFCGLQNEAFFHKLFRTAGNIWQQVGLITKEASPYRKSAWQFVRELRLKDILPLPGQSVKEFRLALLPWIGYGPFFIAQQKGFFTREGVKVQIEMIPDTFKRRQALIKGQVHAIISTTDAFAIGAAPAADPQKQAFGNLPAKVVLKLDDSDGGDGMVVKPAITTVQDLKGKKVAFTESMPSHFFLLYILLTAGLEPDDIQAVAKPSVEAAAQAFENGEVDAAVVWEPHVTRLSRDKTRGRILLTTKEVRGLISDILVVSDQALKNRRQEVQGVINAWFRAVEYFKHNQEEAIAIMAKGLGLSPDEARDMVTGIKYADLQENKRFAGTPAKPGPFTELFEKAGQFWQDLNIIQKAVPAETKSDWGFVRQAFPAGVNPFRIAYIQWAGYGPLFLAKRLGYYTGITDGVSFIRIEDTAKRRAKLKKGEIEASISTVDAFAVEAGAPLNIPAKAILKLDDSAGGDGLVVRRGINSIADLDGKRISFVDGMPSHFFLLYLLATAGLSHEDVTLVPCKAAETAGQLLVAGKVDAAVTWEPFVSQCAKQSGGKILITTKDARGLIMDILIVRDDVIANRPKDVRTIVKGWLKAVRYWKRLPSKSPERRKLNQIMAESLGLSLQDFEDMLSGIKYADKRENQVCFGKRKAPGKTIYEVFHSATQIWLETKKITRGATAKSVCRADFIPTYTNPFGVFKTQRLMAMTSVPLRVGSAQGAMLAPLLIGTAHEKEFFINEGVKVVLPRQYLSLPSTTLLAALRRKEIDAAVMPLAALSNKGSNTRVPVRIVLQVTPQQVLVIQTEFLWNHRILCRRFVRGWLRSVEYSRRVRNAAVRLYQRASAKWGLRVPYHTSSNFQENMRFLYKAAPGWKHLLDKDLLPSIKPLYHTKIHLGSQTALQRQLEMIVKNLRRYADTYIMVQVFINTPRPADQDRRAAEDTGYTIVKTLRSLGISLDRISYTAYGEADSRSLQQDAHITVYREQP